MTSEAQQNFNLQRVIATVGVILFGIKVGAWYLTQSVAILTDALESIINVVSGFIGLYSLYLSAKPKDVNHPYGHGKIEFISAAIEGTLISIAGLLICYESILHLISPQPIGQLDVGIVLVAITALMNYGMGYYAVRQGEKTNSLALKASGKHLQSDTYSTIGIVVGLLLLWLTGWVWLDALVALVFAGIILVTGYKILRDSLAGIMDEADVVLLKKVVDTLNESRKPNWIDLHNLRIIKYGGVLHIDCHLTLPWYLNVREAHQEVDALEQQINTQFGRSIELFVHTDACLDFSCKLCHVTDCAVRKYPFQQTLVWTIENISSNQRHTIAENAGTTS